jgi:alpha-ketoglutarate-dependent taurine dioxygenase
MSELGTEVRQTVPDSGGPPLVVEPRTAELRTDLDAAAAWVQETTGTLIDTLAIHGAVVLRGFPFANTAAFTRVIDHLPGLEFGYAGGTTRRSQIDGKAFEATSLPPADTLPLHQEMAYLPTYPTKLAFFCRIASETGGETTLGDVRRVRAELPARFVDEVRDRGVLYRRHLRTPNSTTGNAVLDAYHKTWPETFFTDERSEVEAICTAIGFGHTWLDDGSLLTEHRASGFVRHPVTGDDCWFNHIHPMASVRDALGEDFYAAQEGYYGPLGAPRPYEVLYADSGAMDEQLIRSLYPLYQRVTTGAPWQNGDVMLVDNLLTAHGRNPFTGRRDVQVALFA